MTSNEQVTTVSLMRYSGIGPRWWAFTQMGLGPGRFLGIPGLNFVKLLGSGAGNGFSIWPNWGVYGLLGVWQSEAAARQFFDTHAWWADCGQHASERCTFFLQTATAHGQWDGQSPFEATVRFEAAQPVAVLTRATIRTKYLWRFWRQVPRVSESVKARPGEMLSLGVGEWPLIQQATFSLWQSGQQMLDYAYQSDFHRDVVKKTRELGWYSEELFARFVPYRAEGSWGGTNPLAKLLGQPQQL